MPIFRTSQRRLQEAHEEVHRLRRELQPDWRRIHAFMIEAAVAAVSLRKIKQLVWRAFRVRVSHVYIRALVVAASARAREVLQRLAPERKAQRAVGDEIFLGADPLLVVASDLGKGITAAVDARGWPHQADLFHALRILLDSHALSVKKTFGTDFAYLLALHHNTHRFTEGPRKGRTPFELLGIDVGTDDWLNLVL